MRSHKSYSVDEAKARMERYCAYQERCYKEVRGKLREMRMIPEAVNLILEHLVKHNYLDETRFAQAFARGKFRTKKWGKNRIVRELKMREISDYNIKIGLKQIPEDEYLKTFEELVERRLVQLESETNLQKKRKKMVDYLLYRGWESEQVWSKARQIKS